MVLMDIERCEKLLEEHGIRPTSNRITVLKAIEASMLPQSMAELERRIDTIDKSNIFRTLALFREHHLVHAIDGAVDGVRYELCHSHHHDHDDDLHPHFYCEECQQTYCLDGVEMPHIELPEGFEAHSSNYVFKGICPHCKRK
jgi:Fur family ferric uptake transcriptional regulator